MDSKCVVIDRVFGGFRTGRLDGVLAKLVLILANHVGDRAVLSEAIALARENTLASAA